jgi:hypothetical protein
LLQKLKGELIEMSRLFLLLMCLVWSATIQANAQEACVLFAQNGWVRVSVYQETPQGQKGRLLFTLDFPKGARKAISVQDAGPNQRIRWDYTTTPNGQLHGNVGATCRNDQTINIP